MEGRPLTTQASMLLPVQARVFETVASTSLLAGPVHDRARQFNVTPIPFMDCLDELVHAGWVPSQSPRKASSPSNSTRTIGYARNATLPVSLAQKVLSGPLAAVRARKASPS